MPASLLSLLVLVAAVAPSSTASLHSAISLHARHIAHNRLGLRAARVVSRPSLPPRSDPDGDGLSTADERNQVGTNPRKFDSDGDGYGDGEEVAAGSNPRSAASVPQITPRTEEEPGQGLPTQPEPNGPGAGNPEAEPEGPETEPGEPGLEEPQPEEPTEAPAESPTEPPTEPPVEPPPDTTAPDTSISSGPVGTTPVTSARFSFGSSESGSSFQCMLDSGDWESCTSPKSYESLSIGLHTFAVKATDAAGNADASPATRSWEVIEPEAPVSCTTTLSPGANVANAISAAAGGSTICLQGGSYGRISVAGAHKSPPVTVRSSPDERASVAGITLTDPVGLRFAALELTDGTTVTPSGSDIQFIDNDITGVAGIYAFGDFRIGDRIENVLIEGNYIHDLDYSGTQQTGYGYGVEGVGDIRHVVVRDNTIKSPASDYLQSASPVDWVVDHNTFLGPSLLGSHEDHQDLWQIFGGGEDITFTNNVARNTETQESLLFQEGAFSNVVVENNLFDHDSRGYTCQIYQSSGLIFRDNTIVGSHWGCLFRDLASGAPGSGYQVDHNVFADTAEGGDISTEGRAAGWGTYDYNVSDDGSADGGHSLRNWAPAWTDTTDYGPIGLPFAAGYSPAP